jgi:hypothetical protein
LETVSPEFLALAAQQNIQQNIAQMTNAYFAGPIPAPFLTADPHGRLLSGLAGPYVYDHNNNNNIGLNFSQQRAPSPSSGGESNDNHHGDDVGDKSSDGGGEKSSDSGGEKISDGGGEKSSDSGVEKISDDGGKQSTGSTTSEDFASTTSAQTSSSLGPSKIDVNEDKFTNTSNHDGESKRLDSSISINNLGRVPLIKSDSINNLLNANSLKRRRPVNEVIPENFKIPTHDAVGDYRFGMPPQVFGYDPYMMRYQDIYNQPGTWSRNQARIELANAQAAAATAGTSVKQVDLDASHLLLNFFKTAQTKDSPSPTDSLNREDNADDTRSTSSEGNQPSVRSSSNTPADSSDTSSDVDSNEPEVVDLEVKGGQE